MGWLLPTATQVHLGRPKDANALFGENPPVPAGYVYWPVHETLMETVWDSSLGNLRIATAAENAEIARLESLADRGLEDWRVPTLLNGWVNFGAGYAGAGYRKDTRGFVSFKGAIKNGATGSGTNLFTLPAAYRPASDKQFPVSNGGASGTVAVRSAGAVEILTVANNGILSLEGVVFSL